MLYRLIPFLLIITLLSFVLFNFQSIRRELAYKLGISGDTTTSCCSVDQALKQNGQFDENANMAIFNSQVIDYPKTSLAYSYAQSMAQGTANQAVLGTTNDAGEEKWIEVSLDEQKLRAWEGNKLIMEFSISSGLWAPTPKGTFNIWYKTRSQSMVGGSQALGTYYNLPNVPHNMFFYQGYAIHGAYWHNNFGHPMSHGCVNSPLASAAQIFDWAGPVVPQGQGTVRATPENPGTRVLVR
ncbi:L,D-transpeptidase [Candidatus Daviesbacteria bacterium]|nr:L,D-transpeptidase [Candidatus Daviesbacteria bacterium]MBI4038393.1 L,D-transpeptidase [Candidatus Daviesbacteria bacterium]